MVVEEDPAQRLVPVAQKPPRASAAQSWMTPDWVRTVSPSTSTGASAMTFSARYASLRLPPLKKSTKIGSHSMSQRVR
ncbi:hypothetical protein QUT57_22650, partial [Xanthomonas citri pv. citri]